MGKSRVVIEVARQLASAGEVWYVELAPVTDAMAVPDAVASAVGALADAAADDGTTLGGPTSARSIGSAIDPSSSCSTTANT